MKEPEALQFWNKQVVIFTPLEIPRLSYLYMFFTVLGSLQTSE